MYGGRVLCPNGLSCDSRNMLLHVRIGSSGVPKRLSRKPEEPLSRYGFQSNGLTPVVNCLTYNALPIWHGFPFFSLSATVGSAGGTLSQP